MSISVKCEKYKVNPPTLPSHPYVRSDLLYPMTKTPFLLLASLYMDEDPLDLKIPLFENIFEDLSI